MLLRRTSVAALTVALVAAAGTGPASAQEAAPAPVRVTEADSGRTVTLVPGQELEVSLTATDGEQWQGPATLGPLYLVDYREGSGPTTARLQALTPGSARLTARTDRPCSHSGEPCAQGFSQWTLDVQVGQGPAASGAYDCFAMPQPSPAPGQVIVDGGGSDQRVTVQQGATVRVYLRGCSDPYTVPTAGMPLFRESASYRANGVNDTVFRALGLGTTQITAQTDPSCFHSAMRCARPSALFSVEVEVVPASPDSQCAVPTTVGLDRTTVVATGEAVATVRAAAGTVVDLLAYTRPSTTYRAVRTGTVGSDGTVRFSLRAPANTRLYAVRRGCGRSADVVLNVATALTLAVERRGPRQYLFSGDSLPARSGGLVVSLYRITSDGREVLTGQARADAQDGTWQLLRTFSGSGRFGFVARTGQDLQNAPGRSGTRSLLVF